MPGIPTPRAGYLNKKKILDWELLSIIAYQVFVLRRTMAVRVVERRYYEQTKKPIPFAEFGYPDAVSYLASIEGLIITRNASHGQYQVEADGDEEVSQRIISYLFPNGDNMPM